jgi:hypothetical protein
MLYGGRFSEREAILGVPMHKVKMLRPASCVAVLALFEQEARSGQDPELKALAEKGIPIIQQHIAQLEKLQELPELQ